MRLVESPDEIREALDHSLASIDTSTVGTIAIVVKHDHGSVELVLGGVASSIELLGMLEIAKAQILEEEIGGPTAS